MAVAITSRDLPGIGVCDEIDLRAGRRIGVVTHRDGRREFVLFDDEGDGARDVVALSEEETGAIAAILGAPRVSRQLAELQRQAAGLAVRQLPLSAGSPFAGRALGDAQAQGGTGALIVAIIRSGAVIPSPGLEFELGVGDLVVAVGSADAVGELARILEGNDVSR